MSEQKKLPHVSVLPTLRTARAEWEAAFAELEEIELAIEDQAEVMKGLRDRRAVAEDTYRRRSVTLRDVMAANRQEVIEDAIPAPETE